MACGDGGGVTVARTSRAFARRPGSRDKAGGAAQDRGARGPGARRPRPRRGAARRGHCDNASADRRLIRSSPKIPHSSWRRPGRRAGADAAPRPRLERPVARLPGRDPLARHRELARLRPRARRQRRRRALHPHAQGELPVGARLLDHRRSALRAAGHHRPLQRHLARRPARLPHPEPDPRRSATR
jgi:hypothetical protein